VRLAMTAFLQRIGVVRAGTAKNEMPDSERLLSADLEDVAETSIKLVDKELQDWALGLWLLVLCAVLCALHSPMSCVSHTEEQAKIPALCDLVGNAEAVRLPDYCWWPCAAYLRMCLVLSVSLGIVMQAAVVIGNHEGCSTCLRVRWHFDLSDVLGTADGEGHGGGLLFKVMHPIKAVRDMGLKKFIHQASKTLAVGTMVSKASLLCTCNSGIQTAFFLAYSWGPYGTSFECQGKDGLVHQSVVPAKTKGVQFVAGCVALALTALIFLLVRQARWTTQIKVFAESDDVLFRQFKAIQHDADPVQRYFPLENPPDERYKILKQVFLMELVSVELDGLNLRPHEVGAVSGLVTLHFRAPAKRVAPEAWHRMCASCALSMGVVLLFLASQCCWSCVSGIRVRPQMTVFELDKLLLLMGACGRQHSAGFSCWLASIALSFACFQQFVVLAARNVAVGGRKDDTNSSKAASDNVDPVFAERQLTVNIVDMRKTPALDPARYREAGAAMPTVPCHVWVVQSGREETAMDCAAPGTAEQRTKWVRSARPRQVQLSEEPDLDVRQSWMRGLLRSEYNPPAQCIHFTVGEKEGTRTLQQIVPPEFIAGHFHAWLFLGPRGAWEKFSIVLAFGAFVLAVFDILTFALLPHAKVLSTCHEVLTGDCTRFRTRLDAPLHPLEFRVSTGVWAAIAGAVFTLIGTVGLRVCMSMRGNTDKDTPSCFALYSAALGSGVLEVLHTLAVVATGFCTFIANSCRQSFRRPAKRVMKRQSHIAQSEE